MAIRAEIYLYYLGENEDSTLNRELYTPGLRLYRQPTKGEFDFEGETIGQTGAARPSKSSRDRMEVQAFYEHIQAGYTLDLAWDPLILIQYDYATGGNEEGANYSDGISAGVYTRAIVCAEFVGFMQQAALIKPGYSQGVNR